MTADSDRRTKTYRRMSQLAKTYTDQFLAMMEEAQVKGMSEDGWNRYNPGSRNIARLKLLAVRDEIEARNAQK